MYYMRASDVFIVHLACVLTGACWVPMILTLYRDQCVCVVTVTVSLYDIWPNAGARTNQGFTLQCMPYPV